MSSAAMDVDDQPQQQQEGEPSTAPAPAPKSKGPKSGAQSWGRRRNTPMPLIGDSAQVFLSFQTKPETASVCLIEMLTAATCTD